MRALLDAGVTVLTLTREDPQPRGRVLLDRGAGEGQMKDALRIAWREIRWEIFGDRGAIVRMSFFAVLPVIFVLSQGGRGIKRRLVVRARAPVRVFPAPYRASPSSRRPSRRRRRIGTIIPLLASPVRDIDIVVGKLIGMIVPTLGDLRGHARAVLRCFATLRYGARVGAVLPPQVLYVLVTSRSSICSRRAAGSSSSRRS